MKNKCMNCSESFQEPGSILELRDARKPYLAPNCVFYCMECKVMDTINVISAQSSTEGPESDGGEEWQGIGSDSYRGSIWDEDTIYD